MVYQSRITRATRRTTLVLLFLCLCAPNLFAQAASSQVAAVKAAVNTTNASTTADAVVSATTAFPPRQSRRVLLCRRLPTKWRSLQQGRQYGQPGFVGEPINLNVVNADIRDILNYITEQYGVNFVIDSSVGAVPVTVNVQDVPWNIALDAVLKANRLGVETNGNILRVATTEVLAKESETQKVINDSRLDASPLVTEFIRLNYARASGTLAQAAGSTGAFSGGATNLSFSGGAGGDATGGSGDQGLLPIISRRLSRRGSIEVDGRSNTLIITDVRENIDAIRQLAAILDQPEPQVEIETRIVIAQHNFSRDLGAQLSAGVINLGNGALGSISTLPATSGQWRWFERRRHAAKRSESVRRSRRTCRHQPTARFVSRSCCEHGNRFDYRTLRNGANQRVDLDGGNPRRSEDSCDSSRHRS